MKPAAAYPSAADPTKVGTYPARAYSGGGYVWDEVLEYRVWLHPKRGGHDYFKAFATYAEALAFSKTAAGATDVCVLVRQHEYIAEPSPGEYVHMKEERDAEWEVEWLKRPRRTPQTIPDFLAPNAPKNRLDIVRGLTLAK